MNKPAAISASLVDVRNIAAHKCVRLEIHVPAEQASLVLEAFGWPTAVDPVPVAIARLALVNPASEPRNAPDKASAPREKWKTLKLSAQAAIRCDDTEFRSFLAERRYGRGMNVPLTPDAAAEYVREICGVTSRSEISYDDKSGAEWRELDQAYLERRRAISYEDIAR